MKSYWYKFVCLIVMCAPMWVQAQSTKTYTVKPGDTLFSIAREYSVSVDQLREWNELTTGSIRAGMTLIVSKEPVEEEAAPPEATVDPAATVDSVVPPDDSEGDESEESGGETLTSVAAMLGLTPEELLRINPQIDLQIERLNQAPQEVVPSIQSYVVKAGDTLFGIARAHGLTLDQMSELNNLSQPSIRIGQKLKVPGGGSTTSSAWTSRGIIDAMMYPPTFVDRVMVSGVRYRGDIFIVGHATLPVGTLLMVGKEREGPSVLCVVADESLSVSVDVIDVSAAVADAIELGENERIEVFTLK